MSEVLAVIGVIILAGAILLVVFSMVRAALQQIRRRKAGAEEYEPVPETNPPLPVEPGPGVSFVGVAAIAWCLAHLVLVGLWQAGLLWELSPEYRLYSWLVSLYVVVGGLLVGVGGIRMMSGRAYGRKNIAWGQFLLGLFAFIGGTLFLLIPSDETAAPALRSAAPYVAAAFLAHLILDAAVGSAAQRVGAAAQEPVEPKLTEAVREEHDLPHRDEDTQSRTS